MIDLRDVPCRVCKAVIAVLPDEVGGDALAECSVHSEAYSAASDPDVPHA